MREEKANVTIFPIALAVAHAILWYVAIDREGVWRQAPAIDQSHDLRTAWLLYRALSGADLAGFVAAWIHASPVHTPLVPFASAILMLAFGESRIVAESVMPVFTLIWFVSVYAVICRLYDRTTAWWTTALVSTFPVFLIYSRTYLFDHALAALFASAGWALLTTRGFRDPRASLGFGVLAGLTALARGGGAVYLLGPVIVALASVHKEPDRTRRFRNFAVAALVALAIAATWYGPNFRQFSNYVVQATYGDDAGLRTRGGAAFSFDSANYYLMWLVAQGPGVPMLALAAFAWIVGTTSSVQRRPSPVSSALIAVFAIDAVLLLLAAQRETARYLQPLMPLVALAVCRSVLAVRQPTLRRLIAAAVIALGMHHVTALSRLVTVGPRTVAPYFRGLPLWDHRTYFSHLVNFYRLRTPQDDFRIPETIDLLTGLNLPPHAVIGTVGPPHAFYQPNGLQLEAVRRHLQWTFVWSRPLDPNETGRVADSLPATATDAILFRSGGPTGIDPPNRGANATVFSEQGFQRFRYAGRLELGDGSVVFVLVDPAS